MSFVTTQPESLSAAASALEQLGTSLAAEDAAAAPATTSLLPAASDEVSALQAAQFSAYGTWYQQVSAQAQAVHQQLVNNLGLNAGSYGDTEAANQVATASTSSGAIGAAGGGTGNAGASFATFGTPFNWFQNTGAAASDFIALGQGQFLPGAVSWDPSGPGAELAPFMSTGSAATAGATGGVGSSVLAGVGQASSLGELSVPPNWAAASGSAAGSAPTALAGWTNPGTPAAAPNTMPAGIPSVASAGRSGHAIGMPRYGVKPTVMPRPVGV